MLKRSRLLLMVLGLLLGGCDHRPSPVPHAPFMAMMTANFPAKDSPLVPQVPWAAVAFCHTAAADRPCAGPESARLDPRAVRLDPYCVVWPSDLAPLVLAGDLHLMDSHGRRSTLGAATSGGDWYWKTFHRELADPDLSADLILEAEGADEIPAFRWAIPGAGVPEGKVEITGPPSQATGLPFHWQSVPDTDLQIGLTDVDSGTVVDCVYRPGESPDHVSSEVIRWLASRYRRWTITRWIRKHWTESVDGDKLAVERYQEYGGYEADILP